MVYCQQSSQAFVTSKFHKFLWTAKPQWESLGSLTTNSKEGTKILSLRVS